MVCVSLPTGYLCGVYLGYGLPGFWMGYGLSSLCLGTIYSVILARVKWCTVAEVASKEETHHAKDSDDEEDDEVESDNSSFMYEAIAIKGKGHMAALNSEVPQ